MTPRSDTPQTPATESRSKGRFVRVEGIQFPVVVTQDQVLCQNWTRAELDSAVALYGNAFYPKC